MDKRILRKLLTVTLLVSGCVLLILFYRQSADSGDNTNLPRRTYSLAKGGRDSGPARPAHTTEHGLAKPETVLVRPADHGASNIKIDTRTTLDCQQKPNTLPTEEKLKQMPLRDVAEVYHRFLNTLTFLCPVKPIYAGMNAGWQVCAIPATDKPRVVYFISFNGTDAIAARFIKEIAVDINVTTGLMTSSTVQKAMVKTAPTAETQAVYDMMKQPKIDILLINAGEMSTSIVQWLDTKQALKTVEQLIVKFESVGNASSQTDYVKQLLLLSRLYSDGYRIFHVSRDSQPRCLYKVNGRDVTGCYISYMIRCRNTQPAIVIPPADKLNAMPVKEAALLYHSYSLSTQTLCSDVVRVGDIDDGGWDVCNDTAYRPSTNCLVYSFGIARDWTFDEEVSRIYGCEVHSFDPSIGQKDHKHSDKIWFHNMGLSNVDGKRGGGWDMKTLKSIKEMLGHTDRILDFVKMDIEESEWSAITQMLTQDVLKNVRQFAVEFHAPDVTPGAHYAKKLNLMNQLQNKGFQLFWAHPNQKRGNQRHLAGTNKEVTVCYELYYLNTNLKN